MTSVAILTMGPFAPGWRLYREAFTLAQAQFAVSVFGWDRSGQKDRNGSFEGISVHWIGVRAKFNRGLLSSIAFMFWSLKVLFRMRKKTFTAIHCQDVQTLPLGAWIAWRKRARLVYDAHELWSDPFPTPTLERRLYRKLCQCLERIFISRADLVITTTEGWANIMAKRYGVKACVIRNIPPMLKPIEQPFHLHERLSIDPQKKILIYAGGIQEGRGLAVAIAAMQDLPECVLVMMGREIQNMRVRLQRLVALFNLEDQVLFLDPVPGDEVLSVLSGADLGLALIENTSLSHYFCLPNKVFEYVAAGIPVLVSDFPEMAKLINEHQIGQVTDPKEVKSIVAAVKNMLNDPARYQHFKQNVMVAQTSLCWEVESQRLLNAYRF